MQFVASFARFVHAAARPSPASPCTAAFRAPPSGACTRADGAFGRYPMLRELPPRVDLTSQPHLDARLHASVARRDGAVGRPRKRGPRLPSPWALLADGHEQELRLYGRRDRACIASMNAFAFHVPTWPLRAIAVESRSGR